MTDQWTPPVPQEAEPADDIFLRTEAELEDTVERLGFLRERYMEESFVTDFHDMFHIFFLTNSFMIQCVK